MEEVFAEFFFCDLQPHAKNEENANFPFFHGKNIKKLDTVKTQ